MGRVVCHGCQRSYEINYGLPNLVYPDPEELPVIDAMFLKQYERIATSYDRTLRLMLLVLGIREPRTRKRDLVAPLELAPGDCVLEVGAGTGSNLPIIAEQIGKEGKLFALDLSPGMLAVAREKLKRKGIEAEFALGNGAYLPYKDDLFDAVLNFGGINTFGEKERAIAELVRVTKPGAKIVIGDEGLASGKENTWFGRRLLKMNTLFANKPPKEFVPKQVEDFQLKWIWRGTFYVMEFRKTLA
ncbi:methyltransferase domain-containing protein [Candidatus Acetothermia bacterium]|nr:methyltransferase domain-containing protein [Candidatus Acetothermia bacterium]